MRNSLVVVALVAACGGGGGGNTNDGNSPPRPLLANLSGAVSIGVTKAPATSMRLAPAAPDGGVGTSFSTLVKVDASGEALEVLDQTVPVFHAVVTPTHIVVSGEFKDIQAADGTVINCALIAMPKTAVGEPVKCLLKGDKLTADPILGSGGGHYIGDKPGIVVLGSDVYFAQTTFDGMTYGSELRKWSSGADQTELLIHLADAGTGSQLALPYVASGAPNLCVGSETQLLCGQVGASNWMDTGVAQAQPCLQVGTGVLMSDHVYNLTTGVLSSVFLPGSQLPGDWRLTAATNDGRVFALVGGGLYLFDAAGTSTTVDSSLNWTRMVSDGSYVWVYGTSHLQRFDRMTATLDTTNYLGQTGLLQVTDMSLSSDHRIRIDGTGSNGLPVIVTIDTTSGAIATTTTDIPRLQQVTPLQ